MRRSHLISGSASFTLYASEQDEIVYQEEPDYPFHSFISDIGGATGVILGMSLVTVISSLEYFVARAWRFIASLYISKGETKKNRRIKSSHSQTEVFATL
ncbi:Oidioi.mRNA.OKI2018_I69.XSR.g14591.t1.cds [Oikopleura dioica]|uniref:Oidioi.mRNA.OKI2018_I69.XSR.g14591.t1.cds n=1 Tax=Oikopleura dioica TaxID=34765 RepID=A0ABN7SHK4_OIKDI|nr:Oidioi.mRNA.OKI2018_I69.XSR.g14591.t1.cds [Oikopleura dioica]